MNNTHLREWIMNFTHLPSPSWDHQDRQHILYNESPSAILCGDSHNLSLWRIQVTPLDRQGITLCVLSIRKSGQKLQPMLLGADNSLLQIFMKLLHNIDGMMVWWRSYKLVYKNWKVKSSTSSRLFQYFSEFENLITSNDIVLFHQAWGRPTVIQHSSQLTQH
jgi:hypothetical protein